jgi:hypothetical protein
MQIPQVNHEELSGYGLNGGVWRREMV